MGCGRCVHYQTPKCKVQAWTAELEELRRIALTSGLIEEYKWSQPCYTHENKNVLLVTAFMDYAVIAFFTTQKICGVMDLMICTIQRKYSIPLIDLAALF